MFVVGGVYRLSDKAGWFNEWECNSKNAELVERDFTVSMIDAQNDVCKIITADGVTESLCLLTEEFEFFKTISTPVQYRNGRQHLVVDVDADNYQDVIEQIRKTFG